MRMLTTRNFDQHALSGNEPTVVLFGTDSTTCRKVERQLDAIAGMFAGAVRFFYVDSYENDALTGRYGVISSPAVVLLQRGLAHWRFEGILSREAAQDLKRRLFTVGVASAPEPGPIAPPRPARIPQGVQTKKSAAYRAPDRQPAQTYRSQPELFFEETVIVPLLTQWGMRFRRQAPGDLNSSGRYGRIDFLVHRPDNSALLTLFENKAHIISEHDLALAVAQAIRYAKARQLRSFVVAAHEGLWVFRRSGDQASLERRFTKYEMSHGALEAKQLLIDLSYRRCKPLV
ncbi:MAG: thioredoxin family protein [Oscillochloridaceae bacterium umkhey_bin13]